MDFFAILFPSVDLSQLNRIWIFDFTCVCLILHDLARYVESNTYPKILVRKSCSILRDFRTSIFEYTWHKNHVISNMGIPYSILHGAKTMYIRFYMIAGHVISNMGILYSILHGAKTT